MGIKIPPVEKNCPVSPELADAGKSLGNPTVSLQGGGNHRPVPGSPGDTGTCWWGLVVGPRETMVLSEETVVLVGRWWL